MSLRIITILTTVALLLAIFMFSYVHWMIMNVDRVKADPDFFQMLPVAMLAFTSLLGWPLIVILCIAIFVQCRVPGIILLSSSVIYGVILLVALACIHLDDPRMVSGLTYLFLPIAVSLYILQPLWLLTAGLEIYFRLRGSGIALRSVPGSFVV
jgi:hypothetical protein